MQINDLLQWYLAASVSVLHLIFTSSINLHSAPTEPNSLTLNFTCINLSSCTKARFCFKLSCGFWNPNRTRSRWPNQSIQRQQGRLQTWNVDADAAPHGTLSPLSDLFAAPFSAIFGSDCSTKKFQNRWEPKPHKNQAVINHTNPACDTCHEIPFLIKPQSPSTNRHGWKLNSLYLTTPEIILLILESLANLEKLRPNKNLNGATPIC